MDTKQQAPSVCKNPKCITNNEPMPRRFYYDAQKQVYVCHYCGHEVTE